MGGETLGNKIVGENLDELKAKGTKAKDALGFAQRGYGADDRELDEFEQIANYIHGASAIGDYDEFKGAEFRDEATKLLFAYDYSAKYCARVWGSYVKQAIYKECKRLGVDIYDRIFVSSLLTEGGKQGARVVGATGVNARTGEFYIFKGKASVICMYMPQRQWIFSTEIRGLTFSHRTPNLTGDGHAMVWKAGGAMAGAESSGPLDLCCNRRATHEQIGRHR